MCAHFGIEQGLNLFLQLFDISPEDVAPPPLPLEEGRPTDPIAAVLRNPKSSQVELRYPKWGLVPSWANDLKIGNKMFNARAETLAERAAYRGPFRSRRCILPMSSFYEFDKTSRYRISMTDGSTMGVAGLWEYKKIEGDKPLVTCTLITTEPNGLIADIHNRMPAILHPEDYMNWLDPNLTEPEDLAPLLRPFEEEQMCMEFDGLKKTAKRQSVLIDD